MQHFPNLESLARASLSDVLVQWSGLGYNRRAKYLHQTAQILLEKYDGKIPLEMEVLRAFPGVGSYMASVLPVFIANKRGIVIETNVRTVYLHHFFKDAVQVRDAQIAKMLEVTLLDSAYRDWYYALMDYGTYLKKSHQIKNTKSNTYRVQSVFKGSRRELRGAVVRELTNSAMTRGALQKKLPTHDSNLLDTVLVQLEKEGLIKKAKSRYSILDV
jgi:A/G-specific adenine glycosylase